MATQNYSVQELQEKVNEAVRIFIEKDSPLLEQDTHEQAISHRVAYYLENLFAKREKLNVDCEYNKHLDRPKRINIAPLENPNEQCRICGCDGCKKLQENKPLQEKLFRPDVVVHSRGNDERNLIAIEIKTDKICPFDIEKLTALTILKKYGGLYEYQLGVFLYFPKGKPNLIFLTGEEQ